MRRPRKDGLQASASSLARLECHEQRDAGCQTRTPANEGVSVAGLCGQCRCRKCPDHQKDDGEQIDGQRNAQHLPFTHAHEHLIAGLSTD